MWLMSTVIVVLAFVGGYTAKAETLKPVPLKALNFTGEYTQKTHVNFVAADDERTCLSVALDSEWTNESCVERATNNLSISKISDTKDQFFVHISIIGGNFHSCDFSGTMNLKSSKLVYEDVIPDGKELCKVELEPAALSNGVKIRASDACHLYYCGFGLTLSGTNDAFARTGEGQEVSKENVLKSEL